MKILLTLIALGLFTSSAYADCVAQCESILDGTQGTPEERTNEYLKCTNECPIKDDEGFSNLTTIPGQTDTLVGNYSSNNSKKSTPVADGSSSRAAKSEAPKSKKPGNTSGSSKKDSTENSKASAEENAPEEVACNENFDSEVAVCESATLKAKSACDENGTLSSSLANLASSMTELGSKYSATGIQQSCSNVAQYMNSATVALAAYKQLCGTAISSCVSSCSAVLKQKCTNRSSDDLAAQAKSALSGNRDTCYSYAPKIAQANSAVQAYSVTQANARSCALMTSNENPSTYCQKNPNAEGCKQADCNSPSMASNKVCVCLKSPNDPSCVNVASATSNTTSFASTDRRVPQANADAGDYKLGDSANNIGPSSARKDSQSSGATVDGRQGASAQLTPGELNPSPQKRLKSKTSMDVPVLEGTYGNGGGGSSARYKALNVNDPKGAPEKSQITRAPASESADLRRFLPGVNGSQRSRGIAGASDTVGADGITGPHSDIWQKIRNRYMSVKDSLQP